MTPQIGIDSIAFYHIFIIILTLFSSSVHVPSLPHYSTWYLVLLLFV